MELGPELVMLSDFQNNTFHELRQNVMDLKKSDFSFFNHLDTIFFERGLLSSVSLG